MGVKCQIIKTKDNDIERVEAPNGMPSVLYESAKQLLGSEEKALEVWAKAYTPEFLSYYGYWTNPSPGEYFNTDSNGEPLLDDVMSYMKRQSYLLDPMVPSDVKDVRDVLLSGNIKDIEALNDIIRQSFYVDGHIVLNEANLRKSGLYDETELSRILSDPAISSSVTSSMRMVLDYVNNGHDSSKEAYFMSKDEVDGPIIYKDGVFNKFGKKVPYNPAELYEAMRSRLGGITSMSEFENAFELLRPMYPELVEKFISDKAFASSMFDEFSGMKVVPVVTIEDGEVVQGKRRTLSKLQELSYYNPSKVGFLRNKISNCLNNSSSSTIDEVKRMILEVEKACVDFGIDIAGVSDAYDGTSPSLDRIDNLMLDLDIYVSRRNDSSYAPALSTSIDNILGNSSNRKVMHLSDNMDGKNIVYSETGLSDAEMFDRYSLLKVSENLYQKINKPDLSRVYSISTDIAKMDLAYFPTSIYPDSCFKNGVLDKEKIQNVDNAELSDSIRKYVMQFVDQNDTEEMIATRLVFRHSPVVHGRRIDETREFNRYMNKNEDADSVSLLSGIYSDYLHNKVNKTELYDNAYKYLDFKPGHNISLITDDHNTMKSIELSLDESSRKGLFDYSMSSADPALSELFYLENSNPLYKGTDFKHYLYTTYPGIVNELPGANIAERDGVIIADGVYDDFVKLNGVILTKVGESSSGSIYQNLTGSESKVKYDSTQRSKSVEVDYSPYENRSGLEQDIRISKEEKSKLDDMLECN